MTKTKLATLQYHDQSFTVRFGLSFGSQTLFDELLPMYGLFGDSVYWTSTMAELGAYLNRRQKFSGRQDLPAVRNPPKFQSSLESSSWLQQVSSFQIHIASMTLATCKAPRSSMLAE